MKEKRKKLASSATSAPRQLHGIKPAVDQFLDPEMFTHVMALIMNNFNSHTHTRTLTMGVIGDEATSRLRLIVLVVDRIQMG